MCSDDVVTCVIVELPLSCHKMDVLLGKKFHKKIQSSIIIFYLKKTSSEIQLIRYILAFETENYIYQSLHSTSITSGPSGNTSTNDRSYK